MKNRSRITLLASMFAVALFSLSVQAADLTGTWAGQITDPMGNKHDLTLQLTLEGGKVTGTLTGGPPTGGVQTIESGKLEGDKLSFTVKVQGPGGEPLVLTYKGKVSGNHIQGSNESAMGSTPWEATKK
jgi:hypothetical protein